MLTPRLTNLQGCMSAKEQMKFEFPAGPEAAPGTLGIESKVREAVNIAISTSGKSREEIAGLMTEYTASEITLSMLNAWTAESRRYHRFPFQFALPLEVATGSYSLTHLHNELRGCRTLIGAEALIADLGNLEQMEVEIKSRKKSLKKYLQESGNFNPANFGGHSE